MKIPVLINIDVEPDPRLPKRDERIPWAGFEATFDDMRKLRLRLAVVTGAPVHFFWGWRLDPQVAEVYGDPAWTILT